jgi:hypothetical protein
MNAKSFTLAIAAAATLFTAQVAPMSSAQANDAALAAGAAGLVGGMILGGALAESQRPVPVEEEVVVRRRPRVIEEEDVVRPRHCWREEWRDRWGDIHVRRVCR